MDQSFPKDRSRCLEHQCWVGDHRRRGGGPGSGRHHGLLGVAERTQGAIQKDCDGRVRSALPQRLRSPEAAAFERKALLKKIIDKTDIQFSESFEVDGGEMYKHACKTGLEGVVSKVRDRHYVSGRVNDWVKKTCAQRETLAIAGFALDGKKWDGIYLGRRNGKELIYLALDRSSAHQPPENLSRARSKCRCGTQRGTSNRNRSDRFIKQSRCFFARRSDQPGVSIWLCDGGRRQRRHRIL